MPLNIHAIYQQVFKIWRRRRFNIFLQTVAPASSDILLDVGGYPWFWVQYPQAVKRIDTLNVDNVPWNVTCAPNHTINILVGDGCRLDMPDKSYDIGFSNSVIEHVGSWERQQRFAQEIRRVSKALWVQTPAYECPVEPHYLTPFVHYFPRSIRKKFARWFTVWGWIERPDSEKIDEFVNSIRLLRKSEMRQLFPDCEIVTERLLWLFPKSYIAIRRKTH